MKCFLSKHEGLVNFLRTNEAGGAVYTPVVPELLERYEVETE